MTTTQVAQAVEAWAAETTGATSYPTPPEEIAAAFPLVTAEVQRSRKVKAASRPHQGEQTAQREWTVDLVFMVNPDPPWTAQSALYAFEDQVEAALKRDLTLGGRVSFASPFYEASYDPAEALYPDGTVARMSTVTVTVGERTGV